MIQIEKILQEICPNGVPFKELGELGEFYGGLTGKSKEDFKDGNAKFITYMNVYSNIALDIDVADTVKVLPEEKQNTIQYGDVLFTGSSETPDECGMSSVLTIETDEKLYLNSFCFGFRLFDKDLLLPDFMKYLFRSSEIRKAIIKTASGVTRFNVSKAKMARIKVPLPPLAAQREIVHVLDKFTLLSRELAAELAARKEQYEYYRGKLLKFPLENLEWSTLEKIADYTNGKGHENNVNPNGDYILINSKFISTKGEVVKFVDKQFSPIYKNEFAMVLSDLPNGRALAKCFFVLEDGKYTVNQRICKISNISENVLPKFLFYYMDRNKYFLAKDNGVDQTNLSKDYVLQMPIPIPTIAVQEKIVYVLDNFEKICSDLNIGLPAEIEKRQQQYEYYRDKLLTFDYASDTISNRQTDRQTGLIRLLRYVYGYVTLPISQISENCDSKRKPITANNRVSGDIPYYGASGIVDYVADYIFDGDYLLISEDGANLLARSTPIAFSIKGKNWVNNHAHVIKFEHIVTQKYVEYYLNSIDLTPYLSSSTMPKLTQQNLNNIMIPLPTHERQRYIVEILEKFNCIINDISEGLPAEIEARQKQYEYYRDRLLTFKALP